MNKNAHLTEIIHQQMHCRCQNYAVDNVMMIIKFNKL